MRSIVCNPQLVAVCNHFEEMYVINPKKINMQVLRLDDIQFALRTDYILAYARLHTNPSDWIKNKTVRRLSYFLVPMTGLEPVRYCYRGILSPLCLPIPPHRRIYNNIILCLPCQGFFEISYHPFFGWYEKL